MPRTIRKQCEAEIYHVIVRGVGRQIIFEDDVDRIFFLELMQAKSKELDIKIFAWCLMENHVHLLLQGHLSDISVFMNRVESQYAQRFNKRHDRVGTLYQGRFKCVPVEDDVQLMATVRYIHQNPIAAGGSLSNRWSSYREYLGYGGICDTRFVLGFFNGVDAFKAFHREASGESEVPIRRSRMSSTQAEMVAREVLGGINLFDVKAIRKSSAMRHCAA